MHIAAILLAAKTQTCTGAELKQIRKIGAIDATLIFGDKMQFRGIGHFGLH
jgi:hypothetical protein